MYRDVVAVAKSMYRVSMVAPFARLGYIVGYLSGHVNKVMAESAGAGGSDFCVRNDNDLSGGVLLYAVTTSMYLDMRRRGLDISALRYEDLVARPLDMCRVLVEFCGLPASLVELGVTAFDVDSQKNSILSKSSLGRFKAPQLTPEKKAKLNELLKKFSLPMIDEPGILEGTLSCYQ